MRFHAALGGSAILLSATLPAKQKRRYAEAFAGHETSDAAATNDPYPQITLVGKKGTKRMAVAPRPGLGRAVAVERLDDEPALIDCLVEAAEAGQAVAWIRNTVADAMAAAAQLKERVSPDKLRLFHARFAMGDRLEREEEVEAIFGKASTPAQRRGWILVATQVAEQSLDLDFDLMASDLAPMDALIQRAGRLWRHDRPERQRASPACFCCRPTPMPGSTPPGTSACCPALLRSIRIR
ncbi:MAG: hypothetical protein FD149_59 [Rhodospirillaceae bacterium]|nr:MAG: hypothetical protein FD149_59 [Rhodospirillaceae bacterium]